MAAHGFTVASQLSVADAFARLIDLARVPEWDSGVASSRRVDGGAEPLGARYEVTVTGFDGRPTTLSYEITEVEAPDRFVMVGENGAMRAVDTLALRARGTGSELLYAGTLELLGPEPPLTEEQLDSVFPKVAAVAEAGLAEFLNPG